MLASKLAPVHVGPLFWLAALVALAAPSIASPPPELQLAVAPDGSLHVAGELLVARRVGVGAAELRGALAGLGGTVVEEVESLRLARVRVAAGRSALDERVRYAALPLVEYVELNGVGMGGGVAAPDDTHFGEQWHLENTAANPGTPGADIEALPAWEIESGDASVVLAVLDTGIDFTHPEFAGRTLPGADFVNGDDDPTADHPHGIWVSGLAAANADNAFGVSGVDRGCTILPIKVLDAQNLGAVSWLVQGLDRAAAERADVVSMSLINYPGSTAVRQALLRARDAGCILVACAGNGGIGDADQSWPGASARTMSIGATESNDARAGFSGTGAKLDFVAPGAGVATVSTLATDGFELFWGCSAATPVASGIVGLLAARFPLLTHDQARELLRLGAEDQVGLPAEDVPGRDDFHGEGRLNAFRSLQAMDDHPEVLGYTCTPAVPNSTGLPARLTAEGSVVAADDDLTLMATDLPPHQVGYFLMGSGQNVLTPPGASGPLCVAGGVLVRLYPARNTGAAGALTRVTGTTGLPTIGAIAPGERWSFQAWFRDVGTSNFSDALAVDFL